MQMELELPDMPRRVAAAATKPQVASRGEIGYAQAVNSQWWLYEDETTPELQWPQAIAVYDQMRRTDAQVTSLLEAVTLPIRRTPWRIDPAGARATVVKFIANDLGLPIVGKGPGKAPARTKGKFSWPDHLRLALLELVFGHMFFEQVYAVNDAGTEAHLKKLAPRMPKTIEDIQVAADGGLVSIRQRWTSTTSQPEPIPVNRLVAYVRNREGGNWFGQSILRPAYKNWLLKDRLLRVQAQTIERNGMGIPLYKAQEDATADDITAGKMMATLWRAGEAAGSAVPFGADLVLRGVEGTLPDADPAIRYHDEQIARAALAHFLNLGTQTGSWALGATFADFFVYSLQTLAQQIADVTNQHVIEDLVDLNFGEDEPAPRLVFDEIGSQQAATAQAIKTLVDAGIIHPDQVLEEASRQQYGLPPADPATATEPPGQTAPTPAQPAPMGAESVAARRRNVRAKHRYNSGQLRDPGGEGGGRWIRNPAAEVEHDSKALVGKLASNDGLDLELRPAGNGGVVARFPFPDDAGEQFDAVDLSPESVAELRSGLADADAARRVHLKKVTAAGQRLDAADVGSPEYQAAQAAWLDLADGHEIAKGSVPGEQGGALHWAVTQDEDEQSLAMAIEPPGAGPGWRFHDEVSDGVGGTFRVAAVAKLRRQLDQVSPVSAAAGVDTHPGGEELKHYWVYGEGAAKWATWTELYDHLKTGKGLTDTQARRIAASWFHLRYGFWPGSDANKVSHGKPPRGKVVGPG